MACPGCHVTLTEAATECARCGYSGSHTVARFPYEAPAMGRFIDPQGHFSEDDRMRIGKSLAELAKKFPQPRICFSVVDLDEETDLREFGFWMMNASPVPDQNEAEWRPWTILLVIDDINGRASVTPGYAIEPFLDDEAWADLIRKEQMHFFGRDYVNAALNFIQGAGMILNQGASRAERKIRGNRAVGSRKQRKEKRS